MDPLSELLSQLPDVPRWLELRGALLERIPAALYGTIQAGVVRAGEVGEAGLFALGHPPAHLLAEAFREAPEAELVVVPDDQPYLARMLGAAGTKATLARLADGASLASEGNIEWLGPGDEARLTHVPEELHAELLAALERVPVATALCEGLPVSFSYAGAVSETLWDISIDTLEPYRRRGFAAQVVTAVARTMRARGREPVWCAAEDNPASGLLARKLGFEVVDHLFLFSPQILAAAFTRDR
ncbi:GNAT family N-acetyltransferase [Hyalangium sp.]|uniref:GNAT family N-acetyltransferase n=1 Tax=Hyalangium sp. TaxID=2028555 RepID=UPI002D23734E|nr:GNAT family N-acetyltransferase [Hyalangium sp.]HYH95225.1 GNAT family N-acetyltransferase [Hyalangium sp.]